MNNNRWSREDKIKLGGLFVSFLGVCGTWVGLLLPLVASLHLQSSPIRKGDPIRTRYCDGYQYFGRVADVSDRGYVVTLDGTGDTVFIPARCVERN